MAVARNFVALYSKYFETGCYVCVRWGLVDRDGSLDQGKSSDSRNLPGYELPIPVRYLIKAVVWLGSVSRGK